MDDNLPTAIAENTVEILGMKVRVYILSDGRRVFSAEDTQRLFSTLLSDSDDENSS